MTQFPDSESVDTVARREHNADAGAKRSILRAQNPITGAWVNVAAVDQGDGTFGISSATTIIGDGGIFGEGNTNTRVAVTEDGELMVAQTPQERNVAIGFSKDDVSATSWALLIDLSDTANFPHDSTGRIDVSNIFMQVDRDNTSTGRVQLGVITRVNGTNADVSFFFSIMFNKNNQGYIERDNNFPPSQIKLGVINGTTPYYVTNSTESNVSAINTGTALDSPRGTSTVTPAVGDIVVKFVRGAGTYNASVRVLYHSEASA